MRSICVAALLVASCDFGSDYKTYCAHSGNCRPSHVQGICSPEDMSGPSPSVTVPDAGQQNLLLITVMRHETSQPFTVSDSANDDLQPAFPLQQGVLHSIQTFFAVAQRPGPRVITVTMQGPPDVDVFVDEFQGTPEVPTVDDAQFTSGIGSLAQLTVTAQGEGELVYIAAAADGLVTGFDGGPVLLNDCDHNRVGAFVSLDGGAQAMSATFMTATADPDAGEFDVAAVSFH